MMSVLSLSRYSTAEKAVIAASVSHSDPHLRAPHAPAVIICHAAWLFGAQVWVPP